MTPDFPDLRYEVQDRIATITLDRPAKLNAVTQATIETLVRALAWADEDDDVRAIVLTGSGRAFCAGADLSGGFGLSTDGNPNTGEGISPDPGGRCTLRLFEMRKPLIAAINGAAVGFGATVLLPCDVRIAASGARFAFPFVRRGIVPDACSSWFLQRIVGIPVALEWMLSGRTFDVVEARDKGLVSEVLAPEALLERAYEIARSMTSETAPVSVAVARRLIWAMAGADHPAVAHAFESRGLAATLRQDGAEGAAAFMEKRPPRFPGLLSADAGFIDSWLPRRGPGAGEGSSS